MFYNLFSFFIKKSAKNKVTIVHPFLLITEFRGKVDAEKITILYFTSKVMILIITDKRDQHADRVESILRENAAEYSRLNLDVDSLKSTQVKFENNSFKIVGPSCSFSTNEIEAVWNRGTRLEDFIENSCPENEDFFIWKEIWNKTLEKLFSSLESTKWLNFYHDFYAENQFRQYSISKNIGLKWPSYICSNDINYLNNFFETKKERILALMDQNCQMNSAGECYVKCADKIGTAFSDNLPANSCIAAHAAYQVRCTVVGKEYFVGKIKTNTVLAYQGVEKEQQNNTVVQPPMSVKMKAIQIMTELNLTHGVFDFFVTDSDDWYFDALNPNGKFEWIEDIEGNDISSSIAKWLMTHN